MKNGTELKIRDDVLNCGTISSSMPVLARRPDGKRAGPVETVVAWAWREELPKAPKAGQGPMEAASAWGSVGRFGELLSLVDAFGVNAFGAVPDFSAESWPCPDARIIGEAVMDLDNYILELPEDWRPAPELDRFGGLGAKAVADAWRRMTRMDSNGFQTLRLKPSELIIRRAVMGVDVDAMMITHVTEEFEKGKNGRDQWMVRRPVQTVVGTNPDGSDRVALEMVEFDGYSASLNRPVAGAYRKSFLDPDPVNAIIARAEHEIWVSAMSMVFDAVASRLTEVAMTPSQVARMPWQDTAAKPRVLADRSGRDGRWFITR